VLALGEKSDLDARCTLGPQSNQCDPSLADTRDNAKTLALVTDVLWITGAVAATTGLVLLLVSGGDDDEPQPVQVSAGLTPSGPTLQLSGRF
jgi:hypothetical protein